MNHKLILENHKFSLHQSLLFLVLTNDLLLLQGGRYALLLLIPRARDGLRRLIADLPATSVSEIQDSLNEEELQFSMPIFYVETTTKPVTALAKVKPNLLYIQGCS